MKRKALYVKKRHSVGVEENRGDEGGIEMCYMYNRAKMFLKNIQQSE